MLTNNRLIRNGCEYLDGLILDFDLEVYFLIIRSLLLA